MVIIFNFLGKYNYRSIKQKHHKNRPQFFFLNNTVRNWEPNHLYHCDHAFYTLAFPQINKRHWTFPSNYIGQYGAYEAIRHIFSKSNEFNFLLKENSLYLSRHHSVEDIEKARKNVSEEFRAKHNIAENDTVIFFAPGDTVEENEYTLNEFVDGYNEFIYRYSAPTSFSHYAPPRKSFKLLISVHKNTESESFCRKFLSEKGIVTDYIFVSQEGNQHIDAMCV